MSGPLLLLDRDGVLNHLVIDAEHGTVDSPLHPSQVRIIEGVAETLAQLTRAGIGLAVVSNQPAWAKGKTTRANLEAVHTKVLMEATRKGGVILSSHCCLHRAEDGCACRKPRPGLLRDAFKANPGFDPRHAWMVGDGVTDVQAGAALGLKTAFLGPRKCDACKVFVTQGRPPTWWGPDLATFADFLIAQLGGVIHGGDKRPPLRVKLFADGASLIEMKALAQDAAVQGFTTNPTLMRQSGIKDYVGFAREALSITNERPISFEVLADREPEIRRQAQKLAELGKNVYVKVPITNSEGVSLTSLISELSHQGVKVNVTAIMTLEQVWGACEALQGGAPSVVSVFAGRVADTGRDPVPHMQAALAICRAVDPSIELLWASPRELLNVVQADQVGCDIITVTEAIRSKLATLGKDMTEFSRETVQMFKRDGEAAGFVL